jgi:hypothetical protein
MDMQVIGLCLAAVVFMVTFTLGVLILLGKCDGYVNRLTSKNGKPVDVNRSRRILGFTFLSDSIFIPLLIAFLFGLI